MSKVLRFGSDEERMGVEFGWKVCGLSMELLVLGGLSRSCLQVGENRF